MKMSEERRQAQKEIKKILSFPEMAKRLDELQKQLTEIKRLFSSITLLHEETERYMLSLEDGFNEYVRQFVQVLGISNENSREFALFSKELDGQERRILYLRIYEDMKWREIAEQIYCCEAKVRHIYYATLDKYVEFKHNRNNEKK